MAIIRGCLKRIGVTLRWGLTVLTLLNALMIDKADDADLMRAWSAYQIADESSTLQRVREEREAKPSTKADVKFEVTCCERLTRPSLEGVTDVVLTEASSSAEAHVSELSSQDRPCDRKGDAAARGEHGQHPDHDGGISGRQGQSDTFIPPPPSPSPTPLPHPGVPSLHCRIRGIEVHTPTRFKDQERHHGLMRRQSQRERGSAASGQY